VAHSVTCRENTKEVRGQETKDIFARALFLAESLRKYFLKLVVS
jgi:hypothetical protein